MQHVDAGHRRVVQVVVLHIFPSSRAVAFQQLAVVLQLLESCLDSDQKQYFALLTCEEITHMTETSY